MRERVIPFHVLILFLLQKTNESLQVGLNRFFDAHQLKPPTKSALTQSRANLNPKVFKWLNRVIVKLFYQNAGIKRWKGFRVLAVDGSTLQLPGNHQSLKEKFSYHKFGPNAEAGHWMSRISYLYDVYNGIVLDSQMESYTTSESALCKKHIPFIKKGDLVLFDRYYASYELMFRLIGKGVHFVFRMKDNWWKIVEQFMKSDENEQILTIKMPDKLRSIAKKHHGMPSQIQIRLIRRKNRKGKTEVFCTSLIDTQTYSRTAITNLYKQRWGIEEAYKLIKSRLEVADFSGLTSWAILQDFFAKTMLITLVNALVSDIEPRTIRKISSKKQTKKRQPIINRTYAISQLKNIIRKTAYSLKDLFNYLKEFIDRIGKQIEYSRKGQSFTRKFKPLIKHAMAYKAI